MDPNLAPGWARHRHQIEQMLLDRAGEVSLLVDTGAGKVLGVRGPVDQMLGWDPALLEGHPLAQLSPEKPNPRLLAFGAPLLEQSGYYGEALVRCGDGRDLTMSALIHAFEGSEGERLALVRLLDVSEQVRMNNELRRMHLALRNAYGMLEKQGRALDEARRAASLSIFAAGLAHEMNNPVGSLRSNVRSLAGYVDDLVGAWPQGRKPPEELDDLRAIAKEVEGDLGRLALLVARLSELELKVRRDDIDLVRECLTPLGTKWKFALEAPEAVRMKSDARALTRALEKLLDNATLAAGPQGHVKLVVTEDGKSVSLAVEDDGPGIPEKIRALVFDPFFTTRPPGSGLGLGLFLASRMASALGGEITLHEVPGGGTRALLKVPLALPEIEQGKKSYEDFRIG